MKRILNLDNHTDRRCQCLLDDLGHARYKNMYLFNQRYLITEEHAYRRGAVCVQCKNHGMRLWFIMNGMEFFGCTAESSRDLANKIANVGQAWQCIHKI